MALPNKPHAHLRKLAFNRQTLRTVVKCPAGKTIYNDANNILDVTQKPNGELYARLLIIPDATMPVPPERFVEAPDITIDYQITDPPDLKIFIYTFNSYSNPPSYPPIQNYENSYAGKTVIHRDDEDEKDDE